MDLGDDGSASRWFCQKCNRPITKTGCKDCECGCKTWVNDGTNEKCLIVDSPLASPPLNNKGLILLSDEGESEEDYEVVGRKRRMVELTESENNNKGQTYFLRPHCMEKSKSKNEEESDDEESDEEGSDYKECKCSQCYDRNEIISSEEKEHISFKETLSLVFRFDYEEPILPEKEECEKKIEDDFAEMEICLLDERISLTNSSPVLQMQSEK